MIALHILTMVMFLIESWDVGLGISLCPLSMYQANKRSVSTISQKIKTLKDRKETEIQLSRYVLLIKPQSKKESLMEE